METKLSDINKFPKGRGQLIFPISMSRISNAQDANHYFTKYIPHLTPSKVVEPKIGATFRYSENLYMRTRETSTAEKRKYLALMNSHMRACKNRISKPFDVVEQNKIQSFYIQNAFSFYTRDQGCLFSEVDPVDRLAEFRRIYENDPLFQKYVQEDANYNKAELTENQLMFYLEEHLMMYLTSKGEISFPNGYAANPSRILMCYPGKPLKAHIYMIQQNFFKCDLPTNPYQNCFYDLENKVLYDAMKIDLEEYKY